MKVLAPILALLLTGCVTRAVTERHDNKSVAGSVAQGTRVVATDTHKAFVELRELADTVQAAVSYNAAEAVNLQRNLRKTVLRAEGDLRDLCASASQALDRLSESLSAAIYATTAGLVAVLLAWARRIWRKPV